MTQQKPATATETQQQKEALLQEIYTLESQNRHLSTFMTTTQQLLQELSDNSDTTAASDASEISQHVATVSDSATLTDGISGSSSSNDDVSNNDNFIPQDTHLFLRNSFLYEIQTEMVSIQYMVTLPIMGKSSSSSPTTNDKQQEAEPTATKIPEEFSKVFNASQWKNLLEKASQQPAKHFTIVRCTIHDNLFHPQAGGQASDEGTISLMQPKDNLLPSLQVVKVLKEEGDVAIYALLEHDETVSKQDIEEAYAAGTKIMARLNQESRELNARLHSAGHLLDLAVQKAGMDQWSANKGFHFKSGPYVEYKMNGQSVQDKDAFLKQVQHHIDELLAQDGEVQVEYLPADQVKEKCGSVPSWFDGDYLRTVTYGSSSCPCSGTHVQRFSQIGEVNVRKAKKKKQLFRISYDLN